MSSCGGSSGNGGAVMTPTVTPPQPTFTAANAEPVATLTVVLGEAALLFADEAALALQKFDGTTLSQQPNNCKAGSVRYLLTDNDQDGGLSVGDRIRTDYNNCVTPSTDGRFSGDLFVTLEEIDASRGTDDVRYVATVDAGAVTIFYAEGVVRAIGAMTVEFQRGIYESHLRVSGDVDLSISLVSSGAAVRAEWQSMAVTKREFYETANYEVSMAGTYESNLFEGAAEISTSEPFAGALNTWPTSGQVDFAGNDDTGLRIRSDGSGPGDFAVFSVDEDGDGVFEELAETRDWQIITLGNLWWFELSSPYESAIRSYDPDDFRILTWRPHVRGDFDSEPTAANPTIRILTSRTVDPGSLPDSIQLESMQTDWPFMDIVLDVDVEVRGAMILFRPMQQLAFGAPYRFPTEPFQISDTNGNQVWVTEFDSNISVVDELVAAATPEEAFGFPGDQIQPSSAGSYADEGDITGFEWTQVLGPVAVITGANQPTATITLPDTTQTELLRVHLQATNEFGEIDFAKTDITLFPSPSEIDLVYVRALTTESDWREWYLTPANGQQQYSHNGSYQIYITHDTDYVNEELARAFRQDWRIDIQAPTTTDIMAELYDNITQTSATETEPGFSVIGDASCDSAPSRFEVLEFTTDAAGQPATLAIDYVTQCDGAGGFERIEGFIRLRSGVPLPAPD